MKAVGNWWNTLPSGEQQLLGMSIAAGSFVVGTLIAMVLTWVFGL